MVYLTSGTDVKCVFNCDVNHDLSKFALLFFIIAPHINYKA